MYLKKLDLLGFKSFPDKIKLEFNKGITAVVGPNGSGKSNIADAVRWVLGEQSAKNLRGGKMEDVIFSGTQNRKPLGLAEVSITIDNSDHKLSIDFSEVTITRRVFRSGESAYLINGTVCRLKDINELFMDTGVGKEGYSIIGQGRVDEILSTKSDERRLLFDEAAGIVKFKNRRNEAENKLFREEQNLIRVDDIILELESQIQPLLIQSDKAKKYLNIAEQLKLVSINVFLLEIEKYESDFIKLNDDNIKFESFVEQEKSHIEKTRSILKCTKENILVVEAELKHLAESMSQLRTSLLQNESDIKLFQEQIHHAQNNIEKLYLSIEKNNIKMNETKNEMDICVSKKNAQLLSIKRLNNNLDQLQADFDELNSTLVENESQADSFKSDLIEKIKKTADAKSNIERVSSLVTHQTDKMQQSVKELTVNNSIIHDKNIHIEAQEIRKNENIVIQAQLLDSIKKLKQQQLNIDEKIKGLNVQNNNLLRKINESESKLKILLDMEREHDGFYKSVKVILKLSEKNELGGIAGAVGELLSVPANCETAIEIALGSNLQSIITHTEEHARIAIEYLKRSNSGRATFLPLSAVSGKSFSVELRNNIIQEFGVVGIAKELVSFDISYDNVISNLLGKTVIVDNIQNAIKIARKYKYSFRIVTLDGEILNTTGALTGGSLNNKSTNLFGRAREISQLKINLGKFEDNSLLLRQEIKEEEDQYSICVKKIQAAENEYQERKMTISSIDLDITQASSYVADLVKKTEAIEYDIKQLEEKNTESTKMLECYNNILNELNVEIDKIQGELLLYQNSMSSDKASREQILDKLTKYKVDISSREQEIKALSENICRLEKEIKNINDENDSFEREISELEKSKSKKLGDIVNIKNSIVDLKYLQDEKQSLIEAAEQKKINFSIVLTENEELLQEKTEHLSMLNNELYKVKSKLERLQADRQQLFDSMWEDYEITQQSANQYKRLPNTLLELHKEERRLKSHIKELGNVNVSAIEEYKILKERFDFLQAQRKDIADAEVKLKQIISDLTQLMEKQFIEQFQIIAKNFSIVFTEMFGGGKATVKLSDESSVLTSGIDIIAQPPGKSLQSMSLLSGGERALTAIALLFAIQKMKPSPFCILDEIEAALDDANVKRYAEYLKNLVDDTQFIVVTHRKGTMEAAHALYGVTMQEQGVSKLVSVKFKDTTVF